MNMLKYFSCFRDLKDFFKYPQWFKNSPREGKQDGPKLFLPVKNEFMSLGVSMEILKVFDMNSLPTIGDGSYITDFYKIRIENFWKPHSQSLDVSFHMMSWDFQFDKVSKGTEITLWGRHGCLLESSTSCLWGSGWQNHSKCNVIASVVCLYFRYQWVPSDHCSHQRAAGLYLGGSSRCRSDHLHLWKSKPWCGVQRQRLLNEGQAGECSHLWNHHTR